MPGKRVQFDDATWEAIEAVMRDSGSSFQDLTDEAFADLLKKQPVGLKAWVEAPLMPRHGPQTPEEYFAWSEVAIRSA